jgi:hypothetical protein
MGCSDDDASRPRKNDGSVVENAGDAASPQKPDSGGHDTTGPATPSPRWTMMGYDNLNNYVQPHEKKLKVDNAKELKEHWRIQTSGFPAGSPVIVDGKV